MRILLAISVLALAALLWATISIVRHIRKSRTRSRFLRQMQSQIERHDPLPIQVPAAPPVPLQHRTPTAAELSFAELAMKSFAPEPVVPAPAPLRNTPGQAPISSAGRAVSPQTSSAGALGLIAAARKISQDIPQPRMRPSGIRKAFGGATPSPAASLHPARIEALPAQPSFAAPITPRPELFPIAEPAKAAPPFSIDSPEWQPRKLPRPAEPVAANAPLARPDPFLRRPVRSAPSPHPAPPFALPLRRPDWVYFNKDMGDLSDPLPSRMRDRVRSR